jgi:L-fuconolactonase
MTDRVDAHCHLWALKRGDYGWLDPDDPALAPIARDFEIGDLRAADTMGGCTARIVVQAAPTVAETEFLLGLANGYDDIAGVVGWVDLAQPDAVVTLETLAQDVAFKGVRPMLQDIPDVNWITTRPRTDAIEALINLNLTFDALVLPQHLAGLFEFAMAHPTLPIVIDHAAKPTVSADMSDPRCAMWRDGMARLAAETNVCCKISGLLTELSIDQRPNAAEVLQPVVDDLIAWFGPDRLMWGSDWPVVNLAGSLDEWTALSGELLAGVSDIEQGRIFSGTAREFYQIGEIA